MNLYTILYIMDHLLDFHTLYNVYIILLLSVEYNNRIVLITNIYIFLNDNS